MSFGEQIAAIRNSRGWAEGIVASDINILREARGDTAVDWQDIRSLEAGKRNRHNDPLFADVIQAFEARHFIDHTKKAELRRAYSEAPICFDEKTAKSFKDKNGDKAWQALVNFIQGTGRSSVNVITSQNTPRSQRVCFKASQEVFEK